MTDRKRIFVDAGLSFVAAVGILAALDQAGVECLSWIHGSERKIRFITGCLFAVGALTVLFENHIKPATHKITDAAAMIAIFASAIIYVPHSWWSPSKGTLAALFVFFATRIAVRTFPQLKVGFLTVAGFGLLGTFGHLFQIPALYFELASSSGMALMAALCFILAGVCAYLNEK